MWHGQDPVAVFSDVIRYVTQCPPWEDMQYCLCSQNISEHLHPSYLMSAEVWVFQFPLAAGKPTITCGCPLAGEGVVAIRPSFLTLGPIYTRFSPSFPAYFMTGTAALGLPAPPFFLLLALPPSCQIVECLGGRSPS